MSSGRTISPADRLADTVRATLGRAVPLEVRAVLVQALDRYSITTGYQNRLGCRQRRMRAKQRVA